MSWSLTRRCTIRVKGGSKDLPDYADGYIAQSDLQGNWMIPPYDESGFLPPGIYPAALDEIEARFGRQSELRRVQMESVRWMVELAVRAGVQRIVLNGTFVTDIIEPNDVDCVLLFEPGKGNREARRELRKGLPFLDLLVVRKRVFDEYVHSVFAADRTGQRKGMIEVIQWT